MTCSFKAFRTHHEAWIDFKCSTWHDGGSLMTAAFERPRKVLIGHGLPLSTAVRDLSSIDKILNSSCMDTRGPSSQRIAAHM